MPASRSSRSCGPRAWRRGTGVTPGRFLRALLACALAVAAGACRVTAVTAEPEPVHDPADVSATPLQIRLRMRALVLPLCAELAEAADRVAAATTDRAVRREALLWKIEGVPALREALFRPSPFVAVTDSWVLTVQMAEYFESGPGRAALGDLAPSAAAVCRSLEAHIDEVTASMIESGDTTDVRQFTRRWAHEHPIRGNIAGRESTLSRVTERELQETFSTMELAANVAVTLDDLTRRMDVYGVQLFEQSRWQAELFALDRVDAYRLEDAVPLAERGVALAERAVPLAEQALDVAERAVPPAEEGARSAAAAVALMEELRPGLESASEAVKTLPEILARERAAAIEVAREELESTRQFAQAERIAALAAVAEERRAALADLHSTLVEEREVLTADVEQIGMRLVDHAVLRGAQMLGVALLAAFVGGILLLLFARRVFRAPAT